MILTRKQQTIIHFALITWIDSCKINLPGNLLDIADLDATQALAETIKHSAKITVQE
jgi:hypothetical protein